MSGGNQTTQLQAQLQTAFVQRQSLEIVGGGSKRFYGRDDGANLQPLHTEKHTGIVDYQPTELVLTARAGTTICELNQVLAEHRQMLPFEPPGFSGKATLGGTIATALSGPARPYAGAVRDFVLGTHILNGKAELLRLGGEVMKNVAGYDVSRLMAGAMGTLGVILQVSLKVLPMADKVVTLVENLNRDAALEKMNLLAGRSSPISGSCFYQDRLYLRFSGSAVGVDSAIKNLNSMQMFDDDGFWTSIREFTHPYYTTEEPLWRISLPAKTNPDFLGNKLSDKGLIEWNGRQWWLHTNDEMASIRQRIGKVGGHGTLFRGGDRQSDVFHPLTPAMQKLQRRIRLSFDPQGILNPGRMAPIG